VPRLRLGGVVVGKLMDRLGTRRGLMLTDIGYSSVLMLTSFANGLFSFAAFRFCSAQASRRLLQEWVQSGFQLIFWRWFYYSLEHSQIAPSELEMMVAVSNKIQSR
jgi:MFS family permease